MTRTRRTLVKRLALAVPAVLVALLLTACGDDGPSTATDGTTPTSTPTPTPTPTPPGQTYPDFAPTDYTYVLAVSCYCPDAGTPIAVTVVDDEVTEAVLAVDGAGRGGGDKGDPAADYLRLTIDDIIDAANAAEAAGAAKVEVEWPDGQDHPSSVYIDRDSNTADEEIGYQLSTVVS